MNRRSLFKFLGIGAATAAVAPKMLAQNPEVYPQSDYPITLELLQKAYGNAVRYPLPEAMYIYVRLAPTSLPVYAGDIVYYKNDKRWGVLAYKRKTRTLSRPFILIRDCGHGFGYGIGTLDPGNYGFIQVSAPGSHPIQDWEWEPIRKASING